MGKKKKVFIPQSTWIYQKLVEFATADTRLYYQQYTWIDRKLAEFATKKPVKSWVD